MTTLIALFGTLLTSAADAAAIGAAARVALLLALALVTTRLLRGASAALRHSVLAAAIVAALTLPVLAIALPSWHLAIPGADAARGLADRVSRSVETPVDAQPLASVSDRGAASASLTVTPAAGTAAHLQRPARQAAASERPATVAPPRPEPGARQRRCAGPSSSSSSG